MAKPLPTVDGIRLIHVEDPDFGLVFAEVVIEAGSLHDPEGREGLSDLTVHMLLRGTATRTYQQVMDQVNDLGSSIDASAQKEFMAVTGDFLPRNQDRFAEVLADVLAGPAFPADEFEHERSLAIEDLKNVRNDDAELARHFFGRFLYRGHPLGRPTRGYLDTLQKLTPSDCRDFYRAHVKRGNLIVVLAGSIDRASAERFVRQIAKGVPPGRRESSDYPPAPEARGLRVLLVDKPDRTQTQVVMGRPSISWQDKDLFPLLVGNTAFGGTFTARLMREIRQRRGWSYGASSSINAGRRFGTHAIRFFPATKDTVPAIKLTLDLLRDAATKGLTGEEVAFSKDHLANQFPFRLETARKRADEQLADVVYARPAGFIREFVKDVRRQSPAAVNRALSRWYDADDLAIVIVGTAGDFKDLRNELGGDGKVTVEVVPFDVDRLPPAPSTASEGP
jgi:zinc protease